MQNTQRTQNVNLEKCGNVVGTMSYGPIVQVWCESLDGGTTDSRIITANFQNEAMAKRFVRWFQVWTTNGAAPTMPLDLVLGRISELQGTYY